MSTGTGKPMRDRAAGRNGPGRYRGGLEPVHFHGSGVNPSGRARKNPRLLGTGSPNPSDVAREICGLRYGAYRVLAVLDEAPHGATFVELSVALYGDHRRAGSVARQVYRLKSAGFARCEVLRFGVGGRAVIEVWHSTAAGASAVARVRRALEPAVRS